MSREFLIAKFGLFLCTYIMMFLIHSFGSLEFDRIFSLFYPSASRIFVQENTMQSLAWILYLNELKTVLG